MLRILSNITLLWVKLCESQHLCEIHFKKSVRKRVFITLLLKYKRKLCPNVKTHQFFHDNIHSSFHMFIWLQLYLATISRHWCSNSCVLQLIELIKMRTLCFVDGNSFFFMVAGVWTPDLTYFYALSIPTGLSSRGLMTIFLRLHHSSKDFEQLI